MVLSQVRRKAKRGRRDTYLKKNVVSFQELAEEVKRQSAGTETVQINMQMSRKTQGSKEEDYYEPTESMTPCHTVGKG